MVVVVMTMAVIVAGGGGEVRGGVGMRAFAVAFAYASTCRLARAELSDHNHTFVI